MALSDTAQVDRLHKCILDLMVIGEIMGALGGSEISSGETIQGTWLTWFAEQVQNNTSDANQIIDEVQKVRVP